MRFVARRVLVSVPILVLASILVFVLVREGGDDPARIRCQGSRDAIECRERVRHGLGLDESLPEQYVDFMGDFVQGDWGQSQRTDRSVSAEIGDALWDTSQLAFWGLLFSG